MVIVVVYIIVVVVVIIGQTSIVRRCAILQHNTVFRRNVSISQMMIAATARMSLMAVVIARIVI
jgi:hypothetical protein